MSCRECGYPLRFVKMRTGKPMPCDPIPDPSGNVEAMRDNTGHRWIDGHVIPKRYLHQPAKPGYERLMPHFATCAAPRNARTKPQPDLLDVS